MVFKGKRRGIIRILQSLRGRLGKFYYDTTKILQPFPPLPSHVISNV